jgi:hypothetical protein
MRNHQHEASREMGGHFGAANCHGPGRILSRQIFAIVIDRRYSKTDAI